VDKPRPSECGSTPRVREIARVSHGIEQSHRDDIDPQPACNNNGYAGDSCAPLSLSVRHFVMPRRTCNPGDYQGRTGGRCHERPSQ